MRCDVTNHRELAAAECEPFTAASVGGRLELAKGALSALGAAAFHRGLVDSSPMSHRQRTRGPRGEQRPASGRSTAHGLFEFRHERRLARSTCRDD